MDAQALGRYLRQTRESRELTLEDAEKALKIRRAFLEMFELGDFNIPNASQVQVRGFIRNYAFYLGLDGERVLFQYEEALNGPPPRKGASAFGVVRRGKDKTREREPKKRDTQQASAAQQYTQTQNSYSSPTEYMQRVPPPPPLPPAGTPSTEPRDRGASRGVVLLRGVVALAAIAVLLFVASQTLPLGDLLGGGDESAGLPTPLPDILAAVPPTATLELIVSPTIVPLPTESSPAPSSNFTGEGLLLEIDVASRAWMTVTADGVQQFQGLARVGQQFAVRAVDNITVMSSSADALRAIFNGQPQGSFGARGQRVDVTFRASGVQISTGPGFDPTAIASDTPQPTPTDPGGTIIAMLTPSATLGPSPTPSNTFTPSHTPTETYTPSITPTPSDTPTQTNTPLPTGTPTNTLTPSNTPTVTPTATNTLPPTSTLPPTATLSPTPSPNLPPRATPADATPTKSAPGT
jgi:transcriptional regulator with XRE-family HTH domain